MPFYWRSQELLNKKTPIFTINFESKQRSKNMYENCMLLPDNQIYEPEEKSTDSNSTKNSKLYIETLRVIQTQVLAAENALIQNELFKAAKITSCSKQSKIKKFAINEQLIKQHVIQIGKTTACVWEPLQKAYETLNLPVIKFPSKGNFLHRFCCIKIQTYFKKLGYRSQIEYFLSNNKAIDLFLENDNESIFVEIANTKIESEQNILDDLSTPLISSKLIICCKDSKLRNAQIKSINSNRKLDEFRDKISVRLSGEFIQKVNGE